MFAVTIVGPIGVSAKSDIKIPKTAQSTDVTAEQTTTERKLLKTLIAESAGKITRADIRSEPTKFIARTIITATTIAVSIL